MTCASCCAFELGIGFIDVDRRLLVVRSGTIAVAGPNVFAGSNMLTRPRSQCLISEICLIFSGKAK